MLNITGRLTRYLTALVLGGLLSPALAEDKLLDAEQCVSLASIGRTRVVDHSNILFYMKGGAIYLNQLPKRCPGLRPRGSFTYRTSLSRLCNVDIIQPLENMGFGVRPVGSCGLGMFYPIDEATAELLVKGEVPPDPE